MSFMTRSQSPLMICALAWSVTTQHEVWVGGEGGLEGRRHAAFPPPFHHPDMRELALSVPAKISAYVL